MKLQVIIESIGVKGSGTTHRSDDGKRNCSLLLTWDEKCEDGKVLTHYLRTMAFGRQMKQITRDFQAGDEALVDVSFSSTQLASGFYQNKACVLSIQKISDGEAGKGVAL